MQGIERASTVCLPNGSDRNVQAMLEGLLGRILYEIAAGLWQFLDEAINRGTARVGGFHEKANAFQLPYCIPQRITIFWSYLTFHICFLLRATSGVGPKKRDVSRSPWC